MKLCIVINSVGVLFNGLLAELPTILDSFSPVATTNDYIRWLIWGGGEPQSGGETVQLHLYYGSTSWCLKWPKK